MLRRAVFIPLAAPLLLVSGVGVGKLTARALALPEELVVREDETMPRIGLEALGERMRQVREAGVDTEEYVMLYREHVAPVERALRRHGVSPSLARKVAWPLVEYSSRNGLDPATVASVVVVESSGRPDATSPVGARGLMQVMPAHAGRWHGCSGDVRDLYDIEQNICYGTSILAGFMRAYRGDERRALLGYNGCIRGTNTPDCFSYPDKVARVRRTIRREMEAARQSFSQVVEGP
ncbi:MAG TPA: lytic transglycosylase domain-containing protein [Longimicrobiales bacterium]